MAQDMVQGTASQQAAAQLHLERRAEWSWIRIAGTRYAVLPSGRSNRTYWVRADAAGCSCMWSQRRGSPCSHRIAVASTIERPNPTRTVDDLWPSCQAQGCTDDPEPHERYCHRHVLVDAF